MRPRGEPACRVLFPLLVPKHSTDGSGEEWRSSEPGPQTASEGSKETSRPHWSTLRIWTKTRNQVRESTQVNTAETKQQNFTSRYFFTQSRNSTLDLSSSNWDLSLLTMGLLSEPLKSRQGFMTYTRRSHELAASFRPTFVLSLLLNQLLVEISRFLQIPCLNYQLLLQFLIKGNHTKSKGPKITPHTIQ